MLRKWGALVLLLLATPILGYAQNTGKLDGFRAVSVKAP